jgi:iron complex outermembrane receptor protein
MAVYDGYYNGSKARLNHIDSKVPYSQEIYDLIVARKTDPTIPAVLDKELVSGYGWTYLDSFDWLGAFYRDHFYSTEHNLSVSGGNEKSSIYASVSEKYSTGTLPNNSFNRFITLLKVTHKRNKAIEVESSVTFTNSDARNAQPNIGQYFIGEGEFDRTYDAKYFRDKYKGEHGGLASTAYGDKWGNIPGRDVWWSIWENNTSQKETVVRPNLKLTVQFTPWFKWVTDGSFNYYYTRQETKRPDSGYANSGNGGYYSLSNSTQEQTNLNTNFIFDGKINEDWQIGGFLRG